jgi:NAD(P)H-hydrate epimerase
MHKSPIYLSRAESRKLDQRAISELGIPGILLMENAARGCVDVLSELGIRGTVCVCCGVGNNGGDGFAMARRLDLLGYAVRVFVIGDPRRLAGDAAINFRILGHTDIPIFDSSFDKMQFAAFLENADWIVDALLGTGFQGPLRPPMNEAIELINQMPAKRLAVDLPSGLDCDTGIPVSPTVQADHTCTFVAEKLGFQNPAARAYLGKVHIVDIGTPPKLVDSILKQEPEA